MSQESDADSNRTRTGSDVYHLGLHRFVQEAKHHGTSCRKAGIVLGAGVNAIYARLGAGGAVDTVTIGCVGGLVIIFMLMFSRRVRKYMETNRFVAILGNYSFLWGVLALLVLGGAAGVVPVQLLWRNHPCS